MTERPILFSGPMVRAILEGRKTQTRRVVKPQPSNGLSIGCYSTDGRPDLSEWVLSGVDGDPIDAPALRCPYGQPGDRLWVRETWRIGAWREGGRVALDYQASHEANRTPWLNPPCEEFDKLVCQSALDCDAAVRIGGGSVYESKDGGWRWERGDSPCRWRPSIHMPRWASRLTLEVTGVRVERVQEISEADAAAEGVMPLQMDRGSCIPSYEGLWDSINVKRGFGWDANPWVWVVEFKAVTA